MNGHVNTKLYPRSTSMLSLILALFFPFLASRVHAQQLVFERLSVEEGLSQSIVTTIVQDRSGFLWFGTEDGLNVYDGYSFIPLRSNPDDSGSLSYNHITTICLDREGTLWVGTFGGGLNRYMPMKQKFSRYPFPRPDSPSLSHGIVHSIVQDLTGAIWVGTERGLNRISASAEDDGRTSIRSYLRSATNPNGLTDDRIHALCVDSSGTLWVGTEGGLFSLSAKEAGATDPRFDSYKHDPLVRWSLSNDTVRSLHVDRAGNLWIGTNNGLDRFDYASPAAGRGVFEHIGSSTRPSQGLNNRQIYSVYEDNLGILWIGTNGGGLNRYDRSAGSFQPYLHDPRDRNSLSYNEIRSIYQDRSGILWVGTYGGGVNKVDARPKPFLHYRNDPDKSNSLNQNIVWSVYEDPDRILWIGTHGGGLNRFDRVRNAWKHYLHNPRNPASISSNVVRLVIGDPSGKLWIGTNGGGICLFDPRTETFRSFTNNPRDTTSISHDDIRWMHLDRDGILWISTHGGGVNSLDTRQQGPARFTRFRTDQSDTASLANDFVRMIFEDRKRNLWIGTQGGGLDLYDRATRRFTHHRSRVGDTKTINNDFVFCIHEDDAGILWIGTWGGGVNRFDPATGEFRAYMRRDGLPSDAVYGILADDRGMLWISTNNGLSRFDPRTGSFKNYSVRDGLQNSEFNGGSYFKSRSGEMFFGGIGGFNAFYPDRITDNPHVPPVVITSFSKLNRQVQFDRPLSEIEEIVLSHRDYYFSFEFASLDYTAPEKNQYAYKLEGLDDDWIRTSADKRFAQYTTLPPGSYLFRVKASNNDGVWNEQGASVSIIITPPVWQTWWFRISTILGIGITGLLVYRRRVKNVRLAAELQTAHDMQMSIMPQADPQVAGFDISGSCIPANEVGGDFFDYVWMDRAQSRFAIVIGDVSGKAMRAAMTAVMTSGIVNTELHDDSPLADILRKANRILYPKTDRHMFTALCLASLDTTSRELIFSNAGLIKPLLKSNGDFRFLDSAGSPHALGMVRDHEFRERLIQLSKGDVVIFQTDGIVEAQNEARDFYGENRLMRLLETLDTQSLSARELRDAILSDVRAFMAGYHQHDDMTIVIVKAT